LSILLEDPLYLVAVKSGVSISVEFLEQGNEGTHTVGALLLEDRTDLVEDLVGGLTSQAENGVNVRVVSSAAEGHHTREFFEVELATVVSVVFVENGSKLILSEGATDSLHGLFEFSRSNHTAVHQIEVLEETLGSFTFIVGAVSALANLFKDDTFHLGKTGCGHSINISMNTP